MSDYTSIFPNQIQIFCNQNRTPFLQNYRNPLAKSPIFIPNHPKFQKSPTQIAEIAHRRLLRISESLALFPIVGVV
ncbi:hypothetical protein ACS0TY_000316 [Phlomoides rotata]